MFNKITTALVAAAILGSASAALAQSGEELWTSQYLRNPNAPTPTYQQAQARAQLIEGRNVGVQIAPPAARDAFEPNPSFGGY